MAFLHSEESGGGHVAELGLGDGVAGCARLGQRFLLAPGVAVVFLSAFGLGGCGRLLRAVLALEGLVGHTLAELLDTVDLLGLEAVQGLLLLVSAYVRGVVLVVVEVGAPFGRVWAA